MARLEIRRFSDPDIARGIHDAIRKTAEQKQCPIFDRLFRALVIDGYKLTRRETEHQLKYAVKDGLICEVKAVSNHGQNKGKGLVAYRLVSLEAFEKSNDDDGHDWYCWECHREGEVALCSRCPRVFHKRCLGLSPIDLERQFICKVCKDVENAQAYTSRKEVNELSTMLAFATNRMKLRADDLYEPISEEKEPYYRMFVYRPVNFYEVEQRIAKKEFRNVKEFISEIEWIYHNAVVYFSADDGMTDLAKTVITDGKRELSQIEICADCYLLSNKRPANWFSIPCKVPHDVGYAKLGSDPPWPAKVLRRSEDGTMVDVRFFGHPYQRAWVPSRNLFDLKYKPPVKKSKAWTQAIFELQEHVRLLKERNGQSRRDSDDTLEIELPLVKKETPGRKKKAGRKRKLTKTDSIDSTGDSTEVASESVSLKNNPTENGDIHMDSMRMTDDYKIITKLRELVRNLESTLQETRTELEAEKLTNEKHKMELDNAKKESEDAILGIKEELQLEAQREKASAIEQYKKEMQSTVEHRVSEELEKERARTEERIMEISEKEKSEANDKLTESIAQERSQAETRLQAMRQQDREELQRNMDNFRREADASNQRQLEELTKRLKAEELEKRIALENVRRAQIETDKIVRDAIIATKKKSWCSSCSSEAFYHCCWNTNYCSTQCQRVHWTAHRYHCTRDLMSTCRNCQQRQSFPPGGPPLQGARPNFGPQLQPPK